MSPAMQRARRPEAKAERRAALLEAGARLFAERDWSQVAIAEVAREAGLAKGTVYLYFPTKEALFLELLLTRLGEWLALLSIELGKRSTRDRHAFVARCVTHSLAERAELVRLLAILHTVLEQNIDADTARQFKRGLASLMAGPASQVERLLELRAGEGIRLLLRAHALIIGLAQMAGPSAAVVEVLRSEPELAPFDIDFAAELEASLSALLRGSRG